MSLPHPSKLSHSAARLRGLMFGLLVVVVLWTGREIPGFDYAALLDDDTNILFNPHLGVLDAARLHWMFSDINYVGRYLPLGWLGFDVFRDETTLSPWRCHAAGVGFHVLNAALVFLCLERLLRRFSRETDRAEQVCAAGLGALLWALHPLRVESTAWCSGLLYVQGSFFALAALYARLRELEARTAGGPGAGRWFGVGLAAFVFSLLTYPIALFLPAVVAVVDHAWIGRGKPEASARFSRKALGWGAAVLAGVAAIALAATIVARQVQLPNGVPPPTLAEFGLPARGFQALYVWATYVWRTLWPLKLTPVMEAFFEIRAGDVRIWGPFPTLLLLSALAWHWRRTAAFFGLCWLGYLVWMIPVLGLSQHPHIAADRYSYLPAVFFSVALAFGLLRVPVGTRRILSGALAVAIAVCAALSVRQAGIWRNPTTLYDYVLTRLQDPDLREITRMRIAKLRFLAGDVRDARVEARKIYAEAPAIAGVAWLWRDMAPPHELTPEIALRPLQEWSAAPWACLHETIAREQFSAGRARDALSHLNAALQQAPDAVEMRYRRVLALAALGDPRAALHDWLVIEGRTKSNPPAPGALKFAAGEIGTAFRAAGDPGLAAALEHRASGR